MALKILRKEDPIKVEHIVLALYSNPGTGKSTLGFSTHNPILLDFDQGCYRASNRGDSVPVTSWADVTSITADDIAEYKTVVVDTAGRALDFLTVDIIKNDPKKGYGGSLNLQGYGLLKAKFTAWLNSIKLMGKDVVLIAHSSEDKKGDEIIERLDIQGGSKGEIYKSADAMGRLFIENGKRILNFSPTDTAFGKNPANLPPVAIPDISTEPDFLGNIIDGIKEKLNSLTAEQQKRQDAIADWVSQINEASTAEQLNGVADLIKDADKSILPVLRGSFKKRVDELPVEFDKKTKSYVDKEAA